MQAHNLTVKLVADKLAIAADDSVQLTAEVLFGGKSPTDDEIRVQFSSPHGTIAHHIHRAATWKADGIQTGRYPVTVSVSHKSSGPPAEDTIKISVLKCPSIRILLSPSTVQEGGLINLKAQPSEDAAKLAELKMKVKWIHDNKGILKPKSALGLEATWDTTGLQAGTYDVSAELVHESGHVLTEKGATVEDSQTATVEARSIAHGNITPVALQRSPTVRTADQAFWTMIRNRSHAISFSGSGYKDFIDKVLCKRDPLPADTQGAPHLARQLEELGPQIHGGAAFDILKTATQVFLLMECGLALDPSLFDKDEEAARLGESVTFDEVNQRLSQYFGSSRLPYLDRVMKAAFPDAQPTDKVHCYGVIRSRVQAPCMIELIWSYWHEEAMLVQTMNAISRRFQNVRSPGERDPLAHLEIDPLRPLNNLLWGYIQDEMNLLTIKRRAYEYNHHYGLTLYGKAVPTLRPADTRSKFLEGFHNLLHLVSVFYKEDNDTTVIADGFPLLNALREVHLVLAQGAHNQFGDLPWTSRAEMLIQQWLLARPEMRDFLQSRPMVPYKEAWMPQVDTMKTLQGWTDTTVTHFRDLAVYGEQILLTIRYGDWIDINDENSAKNWARYWRPEIQGYLHAYRAVTGIDLTNPDTVDYTLPAVHLQKRLSMQRVH